MVRKLVVKLRNASERPGEEAEAKQSQRLRQRDTLREAVRAIQASRDTPATLEELFRLGFLGGKPRLADCSQASFSLIQAHSAAQPSALMLTGALEALPSEPPA